MTLTGGWIAALWMQEPGSLSSGNSRLLMIFVAIVAFSMLAQAIIFGFMAYGALKSQRRIQAIAEEIRSRAMPLMNNAEDLFHDTVPKLKVIADNLAETSHIVRAKALEFDATLTDVNQKTRSQVARVDDMFSSTLTKTGEIGEMIHQGIRVPVKQISGLINGVRAGLEVLLSRAKGFGGPRGPIA